MLAHTRHSEGSGSDRGISGFRIALDPEIPAGRFRSLRDDVHRQELYNKTTMTAALTEFDIPTLEARLADCGFLRSHARPAAQGGLRRERCHRAECDSGREAARRAARQRVARPLVAR